MAKEYYDVVIVIPLEEELQEAMRVFGGTDNRSTPTQFRYGLQTPTAALRVLVAQQDDMGKRQAAHATLEVLNDFDVGLLVCIGIAGSLSRDVLKWTPILGPAG